MAGQPHYCRSHQDIADRLGICRQRVQQIEKRAMQKIKANLERQAKRAGLPVEEWLFGPPANNNRASAMLMAEAVRSIECD